jgi:hypothetical protein
MPLGGICCGWEDNIKMNFIETVVEDIDWIRLAQTRQGSVGCPEHSSDPKMLLTRPSAPLLHVVTRNIKCFRDIWWPSAHRLAIAWHCDDGIGVMLALMRALVSSFTACAPPPPPPPDGPGGPQRVNGGAGCRGGYYINLGGQWGEW